MRSQETLKQATIALTARAMGINPTAVRIFEQQANPYAEGALLRLPPEVGAAQQDGDGNLFFMIGQSKIGEDPLA